MIGFGGVIMDVGRFFQAWWCYACEKKMNKCVGQAACCATFVSISQTFSNYAKGWTTSIEWPGHTPMTQSWHAVYIALEVILGVTLCIHIQLMYVRT